MCLDAWMTSESGHDSDSQKKKWLIETDNPLKQHWPDTLENDKPLLRLTQIGKVEDMRPSHRGKYKHLKDVNNLKQVVDFIYQVRCNLFHGGKSNVNTHDQELVELSSAILKPKLRPVRQVISVLTWHFTWLTGRRSDYVKVSGMAVPRRLKASRWVLVGSVSIGTVTWVPANRTWLRGKVARCWSRPRKLR